MELELEGKTALVTGGSRGIGKAIARELATCGCDVVICARSPEALDLTARELSEETGRSVTGIPTDLTSTEAVEQMVQEAVQVLGGHIDILVNNAAAPGGIARGPLSTIRDEDVLDDFCSIEYAYEAYGV
ncbi:MAG: SDR family NAD(P)-dependent oxidoreductase, partial [Dehalococcoidia bacterium]